MALDRPCFVEREKLDSEKLFTLSNGTVLQRENDASLQETNCFRDIISMFISQAATPQTPYSVLSRPYSIGRYSTTYERRIKSREVFDSYEARSLN